MALGTTITKKVGPKGLQLPVWAWGAVGVGGFVVYRVFASRSSQAGSDADVSTDQPPITPSGPPGPAGPPGPPGPGGKPKLHKHPHRHPARGIKCHDHKAHPVGKHHPQGKSGVCIKGKKAPGSKVDNMQIQQHTPAPLHRLPVGRAIVPG